MDVGSTPGISEHRGAEVIGRRGFVLGSAGMVGAAALVGWSARGAIPAVAQGPAPFSVVRDGKPRSTIWWAGGPAAEYAATELSAYVAAMSGASLPVRAAGGWPFGDVVVVVPGRAHHPSPDAIRPVLETLETASTDSFVIDAAPSRLVLAGVGPRATLYAVYALLEQLGVRFFAPAFSFYEGTNEYVPNSRDVVVPAFRATQRPRLELRRIYAEEGYTHTVQSIPALLDWMAKARLNTFVYPTDYVGIGVTKYDHVRDVVSREAGLRGIQIEVGGHGYESFLPEQEYPQFYTGGTNVFDIFNPDALNAYLDKVVAFLRERPEITIFDCWPPDGANYNGPLTTHYGKGANAESVVVNALAARLRDELPSVRVERIAYHQTVEPPDPEYACDPEVLVDYAPFSRNFATYLGDPSNSANSNQAGPLARWRESFDGRISMYEYYRRYRWRSQPVQVRDVAVQDAAWESALGTTGVQGMGMYSEPAEWMTYEFMMSLVAALSWDGDLDAETFTSGYLESRFGSAAGPHVRQYLDQTQGDPDFNNSVAGAQGAIRRYTAAKDALRQALATTDDRSGAVLLERLVTNATIVLADMEIGLLEPVGGRSLSDAVGTYRALVEDHQFQGIVLPNMQVRWRWGEGGPYANAAVRQAVFDAYSSPAYGRMTPRAVLVPDRTSVVTVIAQDVDFQGHVVHWSADVPDGMTLQPNSGVLAVEPGRTASVPAELALDDAPSGGAVVEVRFWAGERQLPSAQCTVTVRRPVDTIRVDCGSDTPYTGADGTVWSADGFHNGGVAARWAEDIGGTEDDELYRTFRRSGSASRPLSYELPLRAGTYDVTLGFMEPYYGAADRRVFDVIANGTSMIRDLDVYAAAGGKFIAITRSFTTTLEDDLLTLTFPASRDLGLVCRIDATPHVADDAAD